MQSKKRESVVVRKSNKIRLELRGLSRQLDKAAARVKTAEENKRVILRKIKIKNEECLTFLSQYTAN